jgi:hypothetical protein
MNKINEEVKVLRTNPNGSLFDDVCTNVSDIRLLLSPKA